MKKIFLILILGCGIMFTASAQLKFGIKAGVTSSSIKTDEVLNNLNEGAYDQIVVEGANSKVGFQGGIFLRLGEKKVYLQPELLFSSTSGEVEVKTLLNDNEVTSTIRDQSFKKIDIPIMLGLKFGPARIQAGPIASIILDHEPALADIVTTDYEEEYNSATWGYQAGVGLDVWKLTFDLKYEGNLSKLGSGVTIGNENFNFDSRNSQIIFTVGFMF